MNSCLTRALAVALVFVPSLVLAQAAPPLPPPPPPPPPPGSTGPISTKPLEAGTGLILGRVVEAGTTTGIADATVTISGAALGVNNQRFTNGLAAGPRITLTDANGTFLFRDLPPGSFQLNATASGFSAAGYQQARPNQVRRSLDLPRPVELGVAEKRGDITINLWRHSAITGAVLDDVGEPVVGITVAVLTRTLVSGKPVMQNYATATTDDRGVYWAEVVPGDYVVGILTAPTTLPNSWLDDWAKVIAAGGDGVSAFAGRMNAAGLVGLSSTSGFRIGEAAVVPPNAGWVAPPAIGRDGRLVAYPSTFHPAATSAATAVVLSVRSGEERPGVNIVVTPRPLVRVSGRLTGPNGPIPSLVVRLITNDQAAAMSVPPSQIDEAVSMTDAEGRFIFPGVVPGQYRLRVLRPPPVAATADSILWALEYITVGAEDVDGIELRAKPGATLNGTVVFEEGIPQPAPDLRRFGVNLRPVPGTAGALLTLPLGSFLLNPSGQFTTDEHVPGPYILEPVNVPAGWAVKSVVVGGLDAADVPVELPQTGLDNVRITLTSRISRIGGSIRGAADKPPTGAIVGVFPVDRAMWRRVGMQSRRTQAAIPRRDGTYAITGLPPGDYYLVATEGEAPDYSDPVVLTSLIPSATRVTLVAGEQKAVDLRVVVRK